MTFSIITGLKIHYYKIIFIRDLMEYEERVYTRGGKTKQQRKLI